MTDIYHTIKTASTGIFKDRNSKFIAKAYPVRSEDDVKKIQKDLRKEFYDARHHCYAWRLGADKKRFRANDDGEPSNSAGTPILNQIQSYDLTNILVVVIRYFGGTKLGVPGLINAYKKATALAIENNEIIEKKVLAYYELIFEYDQMNTVMRILNDLDAEIGEQTFMENCTINFAIAKKYKDMLKSKIDLVHKTRLQYKKTE